LLFLGVDRTRTASFVGVRYRLPLVSAHLVLGEDVRRTVGWSFRFVGWCRPGVGFPATGKPVPFGSLAAIELVHGSPCGRGVLYLTSSPLGGLPVTGHCTMPTIFSIVLPITQLDGSWTPVGWLRSSSPINQICFTPRLSLLG